MPFRRSSTPRPFRGRVAREGGPRSLSRPWRDWLATNALGSVPRDVLLETLVTNGVPRPVAEREVDAVLCSPLLAGARRVGSRAARRELRARLERESGKLASQPTAIERRHGLSGDELLERYYARGYRSSSPTRSRRGRRSPAGALRPSQSGSQAPK